MRNSHVNPANLLFALLLSIASLTSTSTAQDALKPCDYPSLKKIAKVFINTYKLNDLNRGNFNNFVFIKDPSGWKVIIRIPQELEIIVWSSLDGYPDYIDTLGYEEAPIMGLLSNLSLYEYTIYPFYGYPGWKDDVIDFYENKDIKSLSDNTLYGLGRAYSLKASDILWSHSQYSSVSEAQGEEAKRRDLNRYTEYAEKAIASFNVILERSPAYSTYVGLIDVKFYNEIIARFYELKLFGFEKEANKLLWKYDPEQLYDEFWISYAKAILSMAEDNAIVFTNGDNDTYPLLWLQEIKNYRHDVLIVNLSLLNDPKYISLLNKSDFGNMGLTTGFTDDQLLRLKDKIILVDSPDPLGSIRYFSESQKKVSENIQYESDIITIKTGEYSNVFINSDGFVDTVTFFIGPEGRILSVSEFLVKTIINKQAGKRPFYFTKGMQPQYMDILGYGQIKDQGLVYKVEKPRGEILIMDGHPYDIQSLRSLTKDYKFNVPAPEYFSRKIIYDFIIESNMILLFSLNNSVTPDSLNNMMLSFLNHYPPGKTGINFYFPFVTGQLYKSSASSGYVIERLQAYIENLRLAVLSVKLRDDDPRDVEQLKFFQSVTSYLKEKVYLQDHPDLAYQLLEIEDLISKKLLEFPELSFK